MPPLAENSGKTAKRKPRGKPFPKGTSGNPGGRPKNDLAKAIAQAVFESNPEAIRAAFQKALSKGNSHVFKELADRAYGKVSQPIEGSIDVNLTSVIEKARKRAD